MPGLDVTISGEGRPLVLLHSLLQDRSSFDDIARRLSSQRKVFNINLPGFGASPSAEPLDGYADRIAQALEELGVGPDADVLGNGLGGFTALTLAIRHPARLDRLVLVGGAIRFPDAGRATFSAMADKAEAEGLAPLADAAMSRMFPEDYLAAHPEQIAERRRVFLSIDPSVFASACRALAVFDLVDDLKRVQALSLVAVGEHDSATPPILGRELAAALPHGRFQLVAGAGHAPHLQTPDAFIAAIAPF